MAKIEKKAAAPKKEKKIKIPKLFQKPIKEKVFDKNILKKIYISKDKEFIQSLMIKDSEGNYILKSGITVEDSKKLKDIADAVKKNKSGAVDTGKITVLVIILAVIVIFNMFFKNLLVKWGIESGLESAFNAKAQVTGVNLEILRAHIVFQHLEVANENSPMKNLFELGKTEIKLNSPQILYGKLVVENIECQNIKMNTDRKTDGSLPKKKAAEKKETSSSPKKEEQPIVDMKKVDVNKVLEDNKSKLQSLNKVSNANAALAAMTNKWDNKINESKKNVDNVSKALEDVKKIDTSSLKTPQDIQAALAKVNAAASSTESLKKDVADINKALETDKAASDKLLKDAQSSIDSDYKYLLSAIKLPGGGVQGIVASIAGEYLKSKLGNLYVYAMKAKTYASAAGGGKKKAPEPSPKRRGGYDVPFPTTVYPKFLLKNASASAGAKNENYYLDAFLKDASSDEDLWGKPATFHLAKVENGQLLGLDGYFDTRKKAQNTVGLTIQANNYPFEMMDGLDVVKARSIKGSSALNTTLTMDKQSRTSGKATITLTKVKVDIIDKEDFIAKTVKEAIEDTPKIVIELSYGIGANGETTINAKSNIDTIISKKFGKVFGDMSKKYEKELKDGLMKQMGPELSKNKELAGAFSKLEGLSKGNMKDADSLKKELEKKKNDILNAQKSGATKELENKVNEATKNLPKLPGF